MKISNGMKWVAACIAFASSTMVFAGSVYTTVVYGGTVLHDGMLCTQEITKKYSDPSMEDRFFLVSSINYVFCVTPYPIGTKKTGTIGTIGSVGAPGTAGPGGPQGRILDPERDGLVGSQGRIVDPKREGLVGASGLSGRQGNITDPTSYEPPSRKGLQ